MGNEESGMKYERFDDDTESLLGPISLPKPIPKFIPRKVKPVRRPAGEVRGPLPAAAVKDGQPAAEVMGGVTVFWLAKAFGMEVSTVRKKLSDCPHLARRTSGYVYSIAVAATYLVRPRMNIREYLEQMKAHELPTQLQPTYWEGVLKRQRFEVQARDLWCSEDVMEVLSEIFKTIKFTLQLWPDTLERSGTFSDEDRDTLTVLADQLAEDIHRSITDLSKTRTTPNSLVRFREQVSDFDDEEVEDIL